MWWAGFKQQAHAYVGEREVRLHCPGEVPRHHYCNGWADAAAQLTAWLEEYTSNTRITIWLNIWLSGALVRPFVLPAASGFRRWSELQAYAHGAAPTFTDFVAPCAVRLSTWRNNQPCFAVAMPQAVLDKLLALASKRVKLKSIHPWWAWALRTSSQTTRAAAISTQSATATPTNWLAAIADGDSLTVLVWEAATTQPGGCWRVGQTSSYIPAPETSQVAGVLSRLAFASGVDEGHIHLGSLTACDGGWAAGEDAQARPPSAHWQTSKEPVMDLIGKTLDTEFLPPWQAPSWWGALGLVMVFAAASLYLWTEHRQQLLQEQTKREQSEALRRSRLADSAQRAPATAEAPPPAYAPEAWRAIREASAEFDLPLRAIESAVVPGVKVISVSLNAADKAVRINVQFETYEQIASYSALLDETVGTSWNVKETREIDLITKSGVIEGSW